jgi:hypothetical protein
VFRLVSKGKLAEGVFKGETINTPSMLAVEDAIFALEWAKSVGGLEGLKARCTANAHALDKIVAERSWLGHLAVDSGTRSKTSVCLTVEGADADFIKKFAACSKRKAPLTTSRAIAMPRPACASGAAPRSIPPISRRWALARLGLCLGQGDRRSLFGARRNAPPSPLNTAIFRMRKDFP